MPSVFKYNGNEIIDSSGKVTASAFPSGSIIQVVGKTLKNTDVNHTDTFSDWVAITGFELDISPKQTNSDFHVILTTSISGNGYAEGMVLLKRGYDSSGGTSFTYTDIKGDARSNDTRATYTTSFDFYDSGDLSTSTSHLITITSHVWDSDISYASGSKFRYKVYWNNPNNTGGDLYLNRAAHSTSNAERATGISSIIVQEIAGT